MPDITIMVVSVDYSVLPLAVELGKKHEPVELDLQEEIILHHRPYRDQTSDVRLLDVNVDTRMEVSTELCASHRSSHIFVASRFQVGATLISVGALGHEQAFNRFGCCVTE